MVPSVKAADGQSLLSLAIGSCDYNETEKPFKSWASLEQVLPSQMPRSSSDLVELMGFVLPCGTHSGGPASLCTFPLMAEHLPLLASGMGMEFWTSLELGSHGAGYNPRKDLTVQLLHRKHQV